jgi:hypothetical protein
MPGDAKFEARVAPFYSPTRGRLSTREFRFDTPQKAVFGPFLGLDLGSFALKNQFVFSVLKC